MCVTLAPAKLSRTLVYAGEAVHPQDGRYLHVLAYQNKAVNKAGRANAMVLPIPSKAPLTAQNAVNMVGYEHVLENMAEPIENMTAMRALSLETGKTPEVFSVGSYTVAIAARAEEAVRAISTLPKAFQPKLNRDIFKAYAQWYPGWPIAICCWNGKIKPEPLLWWYEPLEPQKLFYPALDAHNGQAPNLTKDVNREHTFLVGSKIHPIGINTRVGDLGPAEPFMSDKAWGRVMDGQDLNRDYVVEVPFMRTLRNSQGRFDLHARLDSRIWDLEFEYRHPGR